LRRQYHIWSRLFPWIVSLWVTVVSAFLAVAVFERIPHIPDSVGYLFQAKYFSAWKLYLEAPPDLAAFDFEKLYSDGSQWWNYGFPGWPAVLALGVLVGAPWIVNPVLAGLTVLLTHALLSRLYKKSLAHLAVSLLAISPWFLFMSASFMPHPFSLICALLAVLALEKTKEKNPMLWGAVAGACTGALALTRPLEAVLLALAIGSWALWIRGSRPTVGALTTSVVVTILLCSLILPYNHILTGHAATPPHETWANARWYPGADRLGFGPDIGNLGWSHLDPLPGHGFLDVVVNAQQNLYNSNFELFGWSFGSFAFVLLFLLVGKRTRSDWLFISIVLFTILGHSFYWFSGGPDFGARYWYQILIPLVVLTVRGIQELQLRWIENGGTSLGSYRIWAFVAVACLVAITNFAGWRSFGKYYHYRGMRADIARLANKHNFGHSLVFVQEHDKSDYPSAFVFNPVPIDSFGTIYARDPGPTNRATVAQHFPDRPVWIVAGSSELGGSFRLVEGPLHPLTGRHDLPHPKSP
jgi:hypothetical protein